jgi:hypothetical protein
MENQNKQLRDIAKTMSQMFFNAFKTQPELKLYYVYSFVKDLSMDPKHLIPEMNQDHWDIVVEYIDEELLSLFKSCSEVPEFEFSNYEFLTLQGPKQVKNGIQLIMKPHSSRSEN